VNYGKTADWIWMPFGVVSRVSRGMGALDGVHIPPGMGGFGNFVPQWFEWHFWVYF